jgi:hypothetical protein
MANAKATKTMICLGLILSLSGGGADAARKINDKANNPGKGQKPPTISLSASPTTVTMDGSTTINWSSKRASDCTASGAWSGGKATSGSKTIDALKTDSTFNLSCSGGGGSINESVSITITASSPLPPPPTPSVTLSASPSSLPYEGSTTLSWGSANSSGCSASGDWSGSKETSGSHDIVALTANSNFILSCSGPGGDASDSVSITVAAASPTPSVTLSASPSSLPYNGSTTLSWSSANSSGCTASGDWSDSKATSGSQTIPALTTNSSFNLSCSGPGGDASDSVSITVAAAPLPTLSFSASPSTVTQNGSTILEWSSTDVTSCSASGGWSGNKSATGSETVTVPTIDSQYTLTCNGAGGNVNDTVNVVVVLNNNGTALLSWTPPTENTDGSSLTDLVGYKIRYGSSSGSYSDTITINNPGITSYLVENLASADWHFVMTSVNSTGTESSYSGEVSKTVN